jgi:hypothetical protein
VLHHTRSKVSNDFLLVLSAEIQRTVFSIQIDRHPLTPTDTDPNRKSSENNGAFDESNPPSAQDKKHANIVPVDWNSNFEDSVDESDYSPGPDGDYNESSGDDESSDGDGCFDCIPQSKNRQRKKSGKSKRQRAKSSQSGFDSRAVALFKRCAQNQRNWQQLRKDIADDNITIERKRFYLEMGDMAKQFDLLKAGVQQVTMSVLRLLEQSDENQEGNAWLRELQDDMGRMMTNYQFRVSLNSEDMVLKLKAGQRPLTKRLLQAYKDCDCTDSREPRGGDAGGVRSSGTPGATTQRGRAAPRQLRANN